MGQLNFRILILFFRFYFTFCSLIIVNVYPILILFIQRLNFIIVIIMDKVYNLAIYWPNTEEEKKTNKIDTLKSNQNWL